jgi:ribose 5-phosphate isomerase A
MVANDASDLKRQAAEAALELVELDDFLGVGTGSTANAFIDLLAEHLDGRIRGAVASSEASAARLRERGLRVVGLDETHGELPVYVDGADEFDPALCLMKGGGGALTREKIVARAARRFVCIVDASKRVSRLGAFPLPVEVLPMAVALVRRRLEALGGTVSRRDDFVTDNGNVVLDVADLQIESPAELELELDSFPGVVTCGLFARRPADIVLMASSDGVIRFERRAELDPLYGGRR